MAEQSKPPALADLVQPPGPVYLRKLDRRADWGSDETPPESGSSKSSTWYSIPIPIRTASIWSVRMRSCTGSSSA